MHAVAHSCSSDVRICLETHGHKDLLQSLRGDVQQASGKGGDGQQSMAGESIAACVRGGLGGLQLARAEAAAQEALLSSTLGTARPDPWKPHQTSLEAALVLQCVAHGMTSAGARSLAKQGLVGPLLEVSPAITPSAVLKQALPAALEPRVVGRRKMVVLQVALACKHAIRRWHAAANILQGLSLLYRLLHTVMSECRRCHSRQVRQLMRPARCLGWPLWSGSQSAAHSYAAVLTADPTSCAAVRRNGSWDAAMRRVRWGLCAQQYLILCYASILISCRGVAAHP